MNGKTIPGGLLVAIEGIDGAGKTTLARSLQAGLEAAGVAVTVSKEPTTGPWGMRLRESAAAGRLGPGDEVKFLLRDRQQHVAELIRPALERGEIVILDRYYPSMVAYQGALGYRLARLLAMNEFAPAPDVLLLVDVSPEVGLARIRARGDRPNHFETQATLERSREIFLSIDVPNKHVIDGNQRPDDVLGDAQLQVYLAITRRFQDKHGVTAEAALAASSFLPPLTA
ncbi:dTMP kinase [[Pseudomonas] boreopolis]|uniref:Thymidylate kinase n=1 Tax=Xanthomonas boreopolis TaxID=86183 RepID=A0A919F876_9XANT|nr:thymidylate kinase [[Pseudomonas] boreopolis]